MTEQADKYREAAQQMNRLAELDEEEEETKDSIETQLDTELKSVSHVMSEHEEITKLASTLNINSTEARKQLSVFPDQYLVEEHSIPDLIRKMRKSRRALKGEQRIKMAKAIDTMIDAYADHLQKCIGSITWLSDYTVPLSKMRYNEKDLSKLNKMKSLELRRETVDSLCKYWEAEQKQEGMAYSKEYSELAKEMRLAKKDFRNAISKITNQSITKTKKQRQEDFILKSVCEQPGITAQNIHEIMPTPLFKISSPNTIAKAIKKLDIVSSDGSYYKMPSMIKKNIWAYTAAFIDSDGYITLDRNMNPRVGLIATGSRGKVFMEEMHKSIGYGRMHLDQKSPQQTRLIQRLNFYSQDDVTDLLTKCLPHFRLKKGNAKLLLELIRMKKGYKKTDWYKSRCDEIFKLMKWENHKDHVGYDWLKEDIYLTDIAKLQGNCKMSTMDSLESHESILKSPKMTAMQPNEMQVVIEADADMQGDCCLQLKEALISDFEGQLDKDTPADINEGWLETYESAISRESCEEIIEALERSEHFLRVKPIIDAYHSCNFGADSSAKYAMLKQQERTFVITEVEWDTKLEEDAEPDTASLDFMIRLVTAKELEIEEDATQEEIEDELSNWISMETGWLHSGYVWYEITADGEKRDWLNPKSDYDMV